MNEGVVLRLAGLYVNASAFPNGAEAGIIFGRMPSASGKQGWQAILRTIGKPPPGFRELGKALCASSAACLFWAKPGHVSGLNQARVSSRRDDQMVIDRNANGAASIY